MEYLKKLNLQLFGGEGAAGDGGGDSGSTGVSGESAAAPVPGEQRLRELGVPEAKLKERANRRSARQRRSSDQAASGLVMQSANQQIPAVGTVQTEQPTEAQKTEDASHRMTWDEIIADPEYNQKLQQTVDRRVKSAKQAEAHMKVLTPALELIARQYNLDPENIDYQALSEAVSGDMDRYEDMAFRMGISSERAREIDIAERNDARRKREETATIQQKKMDDHVRKMMNQAAAMKKVYPEFDLMKEMENEQFRRMTHPDVGVSVEDAYYALHRNEIQTRSMQVAAQKTAERVSKTIQANRSRPMENGASARAASVTTFDYKSATPAERAAFKKMIRDAEARGEKIYPGQIVRKV